ncbi:MAG TPA: hypothetical protein VL361_09010 [Candidatus Limnocylindrales bacterium]|jgi:hypothetical protein|nr:hypothetical protein [Candidatus Limnocylindrales bacterium]
MTEEPANYDAQVGIEQRFNTTHWSVVLAAGNQNTAQGQEALARLCQT